MAGRGDPPEGTPDGSPGGDDEYRDEYRSVVFDESFIEAARLQEFSARERLEDESHAAVRSRPTEPPQEKTGIGASRQGIVLVLLIVLAFGTAIYMGIRNPYQSPAEPPTEPMRLTTLPLAPREPVPGAQPADLYRHSPAAQFRTGAQGVVLPPVRRTAHFSESEVMAALTNAKEYVVESSLDPKVLTQDRSRSLRVMLDPAQHKQFDQSMDHPSSDGRHAATGWMIRFDPAKVALADPRVRVNGTLSVRESGADALEVTADHAFVYALRPAKAGDGKQAKKGASLFTVRREVHFRFDRSDLRDQQVSVQQVAMRAGPMPCSADASEALTPLLAGQRATDDGTAGTDPFARSRSTQSMCGVLTANSQPSPAHPSH